MTYYAEVYGKYPSEDIYAGGMLRYEKNSQGYCDLLRFETRKERDEFVAQSEDHKAISAKEALKKHKDQFD